MIGVQVLNGFGSCVSKRGAVSIIPSADSELNHQVFTKSLVAKKTEPS